jgi:molybdopterin synthase sulfur carrier subunit
MVTVSFTPHLQRHLHIASATTPPGTLRTVLDHVFATHPGLRSYLLDDQGGVRHHLAIFINGETALDRRTLADPVPDAAEVHILQALSGG